MAWRSSAALFSTPLSCWRAGLWCGRTQPPRRRQQWGARRAERLGALQLPLPPQRSFRLAFSRQRDGPATESPPGEFSSFQLLNAPAAPGPAPGYPHAPSEWCGHPAAAGAQPLADGVTGAQETARFAGAPMPTPHGASKRRDQGTRTRTPEPRTRKRRSPRAHGHARANTGLPALSPTPVITDHMQHGEADENMYQTANLTGTVHALREPSDLRRLKRYANTVACVMNEGKTPSSGQVLPAAAALRWQRGPSGIGRGGDRAGTMETTVPSGQLQGSALHPGQLQLRSLGEPLQNGVAPRGRLADRTPRATRG